VLPRTRLADSAPSIGHKASVRRWTCPTCARRRATAFCPSCGEKPLRESDLTLADLGIQFLKEFSSVDGKLARTVRALLTRPGALSVAHVTGRRLPYLGPLQLFFVANALFLAVQSLTHANIFSSPLDSHLHGQDWSGLASSMVGDRLARRGETLADYSHRFDRAAVLNAKAMIILMALAFVPVLLLLFHRTRRAFGAHVVFALHSYAFILVLMCASLLAAEAHLVAGGAGLASPAVDLTLTAFNLTACGLYLYLAIGAFYDARGVPRIAMSVALALSVGALIVLYRFAIFLISFAMT
jgi:Protein of unknown function (DUF3667)